MTSRNDYWREIIKQSALNQVLKDSWVFKVEEEIISIKIGE